MENSKIDIVRSYLVDGADESKTVLAERIMNDHPEKFTKRETVRRYIYTAMNSKDNTFSSSLESNGFDGTNWQYGWLKGKDASIFIKNPEANKELEEFFSSFIDRVSSHAPIYPNANRDVASGRLLVVDPADVHIGKLSVKQETGFDYDIETATARMSEGINGIIAEVDTSTVSQVVFVIGNDILHTDTTKRTTTAGTSQDTVGQWWQMFEAAMMAYVSAIDLLMSVAPVKVVHCPSNHDYMTGFFLAQVLSAWYRNAEDITFDVSIQQRKYIVFGVNLIGLSHGDGAKHNELQFLMMREARNYISSTKYRYFYVHHWHHKDRKKFQGSHKLTEKDETAVTIIDSTYVSPEDTVNVEVIRSPSPPDGWHARNGYTNEQAIEAFVHCPLNGQVLRYTHYF